MTSFVGGCACGAIRYAAKSAPQLSFQCQCRDCQRTTGTGHASIMIFIAKQVDLQGVLTYYDVTADDGSIVSRGFCSNCGNPILGKTTGYPDIVFIHAASLDDPSIYTPDKAVWKKSSQPWDYTHPDLPSF